MKKWYRIFEIINGYPTLMRDCKWNWYETEDEANEMTVYYEVNACIEINSNLTVLPVFEKVN